jgi:hypothetical protein
MNRLQESRDRLTAILADVKGIAAAAQASGRDLTTDERARVTSLMAEARAQKGRLVALEAEHALGDQLRELAAGIGNPIGVRPDPSIAGGFGAVGATKARSALAQSWADAAVAGWWGAKGLTLPGPLAVPAPFPEIHRMGEPPQFVTDLIPSRHTEASAGNGQPYFRQSVRDFADPMVWGPSGTKGETDLGIERPSAKITTIAHIVDHVSRFDLSDAPALQDFVVNEMLLGIRIAIDDEVLTGDNTGNHLDGFLTTSGTQPQGFSTDVITTIRKGRTKLELVYVVPNGLVLHPNDAEGLDLATDDQDRFYFLGPRAAGASPVWSVPVVSTPAMPAGQGLLGDFNQAVIYTKDDQAMIDFTNALGFKSNEVTFRAEQRMGLGILKPAAFVILDLTP